MRPKIKVGWYWVTGEQLENLMIIDGSCEREKVMEEIVDKQFIGFNSPDNSKGRISICCPEDDGSSPSQDVKSTQEEPDNAYRYWIDDIVKQGEEAIRVELKDYCEVSDTYSKVLDRVTKGKMSKPNYTWEAIEKVLDEVEEENAEDTQDEPFYCCKLMAELDEEEIIDYCPPNLTSLDVDESSYPIYYCPFCGKEIEGSRDFTDSLKEQVKGIKDGTIKTYPIEMLEHTKEKHVPNSPLTNPVPRKSDAVSRIDGDTLEKSKNHEEENEMEIKHPDIIKSILNKQVKDRKEWEHQFLIKYKHTGDVRKYLLSMGEFRDVPIEDVSSTQEEDNSQHPRIKLDGGGESKLCVASNKSDNGSPADTLKSTQDVPKTRIYCTICEKYDCNCKSSDCFKEPTSIFSQEDICKCDHNRECHSGSIHMCRLVDCNCIKFVLQDKGDKK